MASLLSAADQQRRLSLDDSSGTSVVYRIQVCKPHPTLWDRLLFLVSALSITRILGGDYADKMALIAERPPEVPSR